MLNTLLFNFDNQKNLLHLLQYIARLVSTTSCTCTVHRGVGEGGAGGVVSPPLLKAGGLNPSSFSHLRMPPLSGPPSSQLAPTPLVHAHAILLSRIFYSPFTHAAHAGRMLIAYRVIMLLIVHTWHMDAVNEYVRSYTRVNKRNLL